MFQVSEDEYQTLRCQIGTSKTDPENTTVYDDHFTVEFKAGPETEVAM